MEADWKSMKTPDLVHLLHEITLLHFKDVRRSLHGTGNCRLAGAFYKYSIKKECWDRFDEEKKCKVFCDFLKNTKKVHYRNKFNKNEKKKSISSTYYGLTIPSTKLAKKPGQKTRTKASKTKGKFSG